MTDLDTRLAPGCFGSALTYVDGSAECSSCMFAPQCKPVHQANLFALRGKLGIGPVTRKAAKPETALSGELVGPPLSNEAKALLAEADRIGLKVNETLARGENPFRTSRFRALSVVAHILLRTRRCERGVLVTALAKALDLGPFTAAKTVHHSIEFLIAVGAIYEANGKISLKR